MLHRLLGHEQYDPGQQHDQRHAHDRTGKAPRSQRITPASETAAGKPVGPAAANRAADADLCHFAIHNGGGILVQPPAHHHRVAVNMRVGSQRERAAHGHRVATHFAIDVDAPSDRHGIAGDVFAGRHSDTTAKSDDIVAAYVSRGLARRFWCRCRRCLRRDRRCRRRGRRRCRARKHSSERGVEIGHLQHHVGVHAELLAQLGARDSGAVDGDRVADLDRPHIGSEPRRQDDAVGHGQDLKTAFELSPHRAHIGRRRG